MHREVRKPDAGLGPFARHMAGEHATQQRQRTTSSALILGQQDKMLPR